MTRAIFSLLLTGACAAQVASTVPRADLWAPNGIVHDARQSGDTLYLAGDFTSVGLVTGAFASTDPSNGTPADGWPRIDGEVKVIEPDGQGGWYIGGDFMWVDDQERSGAVRVDSGGNLLPWDAGFIGQNNVRAIARHGNHVYLLNSPNMLLRVDAETGQPSAWAPDINGIVGDLLVAGDTLVVCGSFSEIDGVPRSSIAFFDAETGALRPLTSPVSGSIGVLAYNGDDLYAAGSFTLPNSPPLTGPQRIAGLSLIDGQPTGLDFDVGDASIVTMDVDGDWLYLGGRFETIQGHNRTGLARIHRFLFELDGWAPILTRDGPHDPSVRSIALSGSTLWLGGIFTRISGVTRRGAAALDLQSGAVLPWDPRVSGESFVQPNELLVAPGPVGIAVGGKFQIAGSIDATTLAALDLITGEPTGFTPFFAGQPLDGSDIAVLPMGDVVLGPRESTGDGLALYDAETGVRRVGQYGSAVTRANKLELVDDMLIAVGFGGGGGGVYALDAGTGDFRWHIPGPSHVSTLLVSPDRRHVYIAGNVDAIGGQQRNGVAEIDLLRRRVTEWNPQVNRDVNDVVVSDDRVYLFGHFSAVGSQPREGLAIFDLVGAESKLLSDVDLQLDRGVSGAVAYGRIIYMTGRFDTISGITRNGVGAIDAFSRAVCGWTMDPIGGKLLRIVGPAGLVCSSGSSFRYGDYYRPYLAVFPLDQASCQ